MAAGYCSRYEVALRGVSGMHLAMSSAHLMSENLIYLSHVLS